MRDTLIIFMVVLALLAVWGGVIILLDRRKVLERHNMSRIWYIALMWRTEKGKKLIDWMASPRRFWVVFSTAGLALFFLGTVFMYVMLGFSAYISLTSNMVRPVGAQEIFVLPGINPYVPLVYGLIALVIAVFVHELSHGILARVGGFKVKSLGLLFILIPIGAFMEPDEKQVSKGSRVKRIRMFVAGPLINFIMAFLFLGIFSWGFMASLEAPDDPLVIPDMSDSSPVYQVLDSKVEALYNVDGIEIHSYSDLYKIRGMDPGTWVNATFRIDGEIITVPMISGLVVTSVESDDPAGKAGIAEGSILLSIDGRTVINGKAFSDLMDDTGAGQNVSVVLLEPVLHEDGVHLRRADPPEREDIPLVSGNISIYYPVYTEKTYNVTLADKYDKYDFDDDFKGKGFLGVSTAYMGVGGFGSEEFISRLRSPLRSGDTAADKFLNVLYLSFRLPLDTTVMPFHDPVTDIYEVRGPLSIMPESLFWFLANVFFYLFWLNMLLGLFNALPSFPLDGGYVFRDSIVSFVMYFRPKSSVEKLEKIAGKISVYASFSVLGLLLIIVFFPWVRLMMG